MRRGESGKHEGSTSAFADVQLPPGAPDWISPDLLGETIQTWQPKSSTQLTAEDAVEILTLFGQLFEVVGLLNPQPEDNT